MFKYLKIQSTICMLALTMAAASAAFAASGPYPVGGDEFFRDFWSPKMMKTMDKNKDGMVSRQEFLDYMGAQFDRMDTSKDKMLSSTEFTDKKMMMTTFPTYPD